MWPVMRDTPDGPDIVPAVGSAQSTRPNFWRRVVTNIIAVPGTLCVISRGDPAKPRIARGVPKLRQATSFGSHNTGDRAHTGIPSSGMQGVSHYAEQSCTFSTSYRITHW